MVKCVTNPDWLDANQPVLVISTNPLVNLCASDIQYNQLTLVHFFFYQLCPLFLAISLVQKRSLE